MIKRGCHTRFIHKAEDFYILQALFFSSNLVTPNLTYFISLITKHFLGNLIFCHVKCDGGKVCSNSPIHFLCVLHMTVENRLHVPVVTVVPLEQVICERRSSLYYQLQEAYSHAIGHPHSFCE